MKFDHRGPFYMHKQWSVVDGLAVAPVMRKSVIRIHKNSVAFTGIKFLVCDFKCYNYLLDTVFSFHVLKRVLLCCNIFFIAVLCLTIFFNWCSLVRNGKIFLPVTLQPWHSPEIPLLQLPVSLYQPSL